MWRSHEGGGCNRAVASGPGEENESDDRTLTIDRKPVFWKDSGRRVTVDEMAAGRTFVICGETEDKVLIEPPA